MAAPLRVAAVLSLVLVAVQLVRVRVGLTLALALGALVISSRMIRQRKAAEGGLPYTSDASCIDLSVPRELPAPRPGPTVRLCVATMTKAPLAFGTWLSYYRERLGVEHFFVRAEDSPEVGRAVSRLAWTDARVTLSDSTGSPAYFSQMERQAAHVDGSMAAARALGMTHLLHVDDDELLYCPAGLEAFHDALRQGRTNIRVQNIEAVYKKSECGDPFRSVRTFCTRPASFTAYANGKAIAALSDPDVVSQGPHSFSGPSSNMPPYAAVVLHYESSCVRRWRAKFRAYASDTPDACREGRIPFPFYCESIAAQRAAGGDDDAPWYKWKTPRRHRGHGLVRIDPFARRAAAPALAVKGGGCAPSAGAVAG